MMKPKTILVVDDDPDLRTGIQLMLQKKGYSTLEADDGREAQQMINGHRPDLVILDMMMAHWGGFAVLEHYQNQPDAPPFIMITAHEGEKHKAYAEQVGVIDYIRKPFSLDRLLEGVEQAFRESPTDEDSTPLETNESRSIRICCEDCGARIKAPIQLMGQTRPCPRCSRPVTIKRQPPDDEGPTLVFDF